MSRTSRWVAALLLLCAVPAFAVIVPENSPLANKEIRPIGYEADMALVTVDQLASAAANRYASDLASLGLAANGGMVDARGGSWATLWMKQPLIPGTGVGNHLTWEGLGAAAAPADDQLGAAAWNELVRFLDANRAALRIDTAELTPRTGVASNGELVQIRAYRSYEGIPVRGVSLGATINHGNLVLMGTDRWGDIRISTEPTLSAADAMAATLAYLAPYSAVEWVAKPSLEILPLGVPGDLGKGWDHRLVWIVQPKIPGMYASYEGAIDAHTGEVLLFQDTNNYATRNIKGGVYPASYDGQLPDGVEVPGYPMPFATVTHSGGTVVTDGGGNIFDIAGNISTALQGPFIKMVDNCGAINETSASGDMDLGVSTGTNCVVPAGHSAGDTHSSRTGFYELNRIKEMARGQWPNASPANTWLNAQLTSNMNINLTCNAFWSNTTFDVNFYREGGGCGNTGELAGVFDHEWGHGMDFSGTAGGVSSPGEGIADIYAALRLNQSCVGRGFFIDGSLCGGYGDPCTPASGCTGIRDIDWAHRTSGIPHTLTWVLGNSNCGSVHCRGALYSETLWDLAKRDFPTLHGMSDNTAIEVATRIAFLGADNVTTWFSTTAGTAGCAASSGYQQFLAVDDDNGNLADGTPHGVAIKTAFDRHEIGCNTTTVTNGGCAGAPSTAPTATISPNDTGADLSWASVAGATRYKIFRADGEFGCAFGKTMVGETTNTFFHDSGLQNGREYSYVVAPFGASNACMGPVSSCLSVTPSSGLSAASSTVSVCSGTPAVYNLTVTPPFVSPVTMSVSGNPAGTTAAFSPNPVTGTLPQATTLTVGNTGSVATGDYLITATGNDGSTTFNLNLVLKAYSASPGTPTLATPADNATNVALHPTFTWDAMPGVAQYTLEVATDNAFTNIVGTANTAGTSASVSPDFNSNTVYFWRVRGTNTCGVGGNSAVRTFSTVALPGDCGIGTSVAPVYSYGFESGAPGWTSSGTGNTWASSTLQVHSGSFAWRAQSPTAVSDQRLVSPAFNLPANGSGLTLQFWNFQEIEDSSPTVCFDGAILEVSTNGGTTWTQIDAPNLLTDPYNGPVSTGFMSPIGGLNAWCGDPQAYLNSVVDISAFAGQIVNFRFRFASDSSVGRPNGGWFLDDVKIQQCVTGSETDLFIDGFESGNSVVWSSTVP